VTADDEELVFKSFDKFELRTKISKTKGLADRDVKRVMIIIHGSGAVDMDGTFALVAQNKKGVFLYRTLAHSLEKSGVVVIRYHKRPYEWREKIMKDKSVLGSEAFKKGQQTPLSDLVKDVEAYTKYAQKRFPQAQIGLLGHSQGTFIAVWTPSLLSTKTATRRSH
jgi:hypothetical protein